MTEEDISLTDGPDRDAGVQETGTHNDFDTDTPAEALIIRDCVIWDTTANEEVLNDLSVENDIVESGSLDEVEFADYSVVIIPSTQPIEYYERIVDRKQDIAEFIEDGGVLVAHTFQAGWPCNAITDPFEYLPRGVDAPVEVDDNSNILIPDHPVVQGIPEEDFNSPQASVSYLRGLPDTAEVVVENSNGDPTYAEYSYGEGVVLATGHPPEWPWTPTGSPRFGVWNKDLLRNELEYAVELSDADPEPTTEVSCKLTSLSFIPGGNENVSEGGDPLNSAVCHFFDEDQTAVGVGGHPLGPMFDNWGKGDMVDDLPDDLDSALLEVPNKYEEDPGASHPRYRVINEIEVAFETSDGETIEDELDDDNVAHTFGAAQSVIVQDDINNLPQEWYENEDPENKTHVVDVDVDEDNYQYAEKISVDGVEGVRAMVVAGAGTTVGDITEERIRDLGVTAFLAKIFGGSWEEATVVPPQLSPFASSIRDMFIEVPNIYTFLDLICLADGRKILRVWDTSPFPKHQIYLDEETIGSLVFGFDYGEEEHLNPFFLSFITQAVEGVTPFKATSTLEYLELLREGSPYPGFFDPQLYDSMWGPVDAVQGRDSRGQNKAFEYPYLTVGIDEQGEFMSEGEKDQILDEIEDEVPNIEDDDIDVDIDRMHRD